MSNALLTSMNQLVHNENTSEVFFAGDLLGQVLPNPTTNGWDLFMAVRFDRDAAEIVGTFNHRSQALRVLNNRLVFEQ